MPNGCKYGFGTETDASFEETLSRVETLLNNRGFRIYTRLYLKDIVGEVPINTLGQYVILGACNADFARELFSADPDIGMLMPCNIIVYELGNGKCRIMIKDPLLVMDLISSPFAIQAAMNIKEQLEEIIDELN